MILKIDMASETPIYLQLRNQIVLSIGNGNVCIGQKLPTVRQLAQDLGVNNMTVNKAYALLKNEGFIEIDRRHGAKISPIAALKGDYSQKIEQDLTLIMSEATLKGFSSADILNLCDKIIENLAITKEKL